MSTDDAAFSQDPFLVEMSWPEEKEENNFLTRFSERCNEKIKSYRCFYTGTTTSVIKSTIRTTAKGRNLALIMEAVGDVHYVALSKAQGCDDTKVRDPNFIGWVRRYEGSFFGDRWEEIDTDVDNFYKHISRESDDETSESDFASSESDDETPVSRMKKHFELWKGEHSWRELLMRLRKNDKGSWSHVYVSAFDGVKYKLINKGARFVQTGELKQWNPPRTKSLRQEQKVDVRWMWFNGDRFHFCDEWFQYSICFGKLVCQRHHHWKAPEAEVIWMDKDGMLEPFTTLYFPSGFADHIAGRRSCVLPMSGVMHRCFLGFMPKR